jgi:hypothetical protein
MMLTVATFAMKSFCQAALKTLWQTNKPLTATGILMMLVFVLSVIGIFIDPRTITGMPAWLKPAKFAISTSIYALTLAWIFRYLPQWPRLRFVTGWITSVVLVLEVGIIDVQAVRGTTSHSMSGRRLTRHSSLSWALGF